MIDPNKVMQDAEQADRIMQRQILTMQRQRAEIARLRLTDEEREAVESAIWDYEQNDDDEDCARMVSTLRGLLERTKTV